jgi:hypothetical protein
MLREIDERGRMREICQLSFERELNVVWLSMTAPQRAAIEKEINDRLNSLISCPDPNWGSITNTSIQGGKPNPNSGIRGDWNGTVFDPIYHACGQDEERAGMFYGNVWKRIIIPRTEHWIGIRSDPTFPQRGITLQGKTYFLGTDES